MLNVSEKRHVILERLENKTNNKEKKKGDCIFCDGNGFILDHDPMDPHEDGQCNSCPVQYQCERCYGTGWEPFKRELLIEKRPEKLWDLLLDKIGAEYYDYDDDLPF